ncbi:MAG: tRNA (adenosine(37)-N6)-threonylcarbamoyltransferase complex ATPase subunit type 1 TsaE [Phycisphaerales bacterium]|nr:tRNA (adenosine(37)-N6)-threonylcarbamoyltransferase complex ATPase subunit type 1 TsaE [Phycisphaerales bacterium]
MPRTETLSTSLDETAALARRLAGVLRPGDLVLLDGALGAGKTTLIRSLAEALGINPRAVASPTFVIAHEYSLPTGGRLVHVDAYRLGGQDPEELELLGWDHLTGPDVIVLIEWGERIAGLIVREHATITIEHVDEHSRRFTITLPGAWASRIAEPGTAEPDLAARKPTTCPITGQPVAPDAPHYPFSSERAKWADLYRWFSESYTVERPIEGADLDQGQ